MAHARRAHTCGLQTRETIAVADPLIEKVYTFSAGFTKIDTPRILYETTFDSINGAQTDIDEKDTSYIESSSRL